MRIKQVHHIAVGVKDLRSALQFFETNFGFRTVHRDAGDGMNVAFLEGGATPIELLEDALPGGAIGKFIEKRGEGVHHLCFEVEDIRSAIEELRSRGVRLLDKQPREGARGALVAFVHPGEGHGVLIELAQYPRKQEGE